MVELMQKLFITSDYDGTFFYTLLKERPLIYLNYSSRDNTFYIDLWRNRRYIIKNQIKPRNPENWLICVKELIGRVMIEW